MAKTETMPWDAADHLRTPEDVATYLNVVFEDGDPALIAGALDDAARALGRAGVGDEGSGGALSAEGKPDFAAVVKMIHSLGFRLTVAPSDVAA